MKQAIQLRGRTVTRADVLSAISSCDELGCVRFLRRNGFREATRFVLRHNGRSYPSKAILGVAAGLASADFFGGAAHTARSLAELGFHVRNAETGSIMDRELDSLRRACEREGLAVEEKPWPVTDVVPTAYFASGSNRPLEIRGLARAGADIGVAAPEVSAAAEAELHALAGSEVLVFIDSGAFSEVTFTAEGPKVVKPITAEAWTELLSLYGRLADSLGDQLWLVAPDQVGSQTVSLERLERYADQVRALRATGARILVPIQKGELTQAAFAAEVDRVLGFSDWIPAMPCKKAATTAEELAAFVAERKPAHVHLLGLGIRSRSLAAYLPAFEGNATSVSLDACWITANVGLTNGPKNGPRRLTAARAAAKTVLDRLRSTVGVVELAIYSCLAGGGLVR